MALSLFMPSTRALLRAPWSASKVTAALRCARLFHFRYVDKIPEPEPMPEARIGKAVHEALEVALTGNSIADAMTRAHDALTVPSEQVRVAQFASAVEAFVERIGEFRRRHRVRRQLVEYSMAVRDDLTPTSFYSADALYRGIVDCAYLFGDGQLALVDHKTGVRHPGTTNADQLGAYAVLATSAFREVKKVWLGVHWVAQRTLEWSEPMPVSDVHDRLRPELLDNIEAAALAVDDGPRPDVGPWCDRCTYRSICPAAASDHRYDVLEYDEEDE